MARRPAPLNTDERSRLAADLKDLASELEAIYAKQVQALLGDMADDSYASRASGAAQTGGGGGNPELTSVEAKAVGRDRAAQDAETTIARLRLISTLVRVTVIDLRGCRPDRPTALWPCGHLKTGTYRRCQECMSGPTELRCENDNCHAPITAGGKRRRSIALDQDRRELMECDACWRYRIRNGGATRPKDLAHRLSLRTGLVVAGEAYSSG